MTKLSVIGNTYQVNRKKDFVGQAISLPQIQKAVHFAFEMVYGKGYHRSVRSGGIQARKRGEKFCNSFQGKLAEIILYDLFLKHGIEVSGLNFGIYGKGIWDDCDLIANGKRINVKSAASFSNLFLLETKDWNTKGEYLPDLKEGKDAGYNYFVLLRFKPDVKSIFIAQKLFYSDNLLAEAELNQMLLEAHWLYDIGGCLKNATLVYAISNGYILPQGAFLNNHIKMDAENYYLQCGDLVGIDQLINVLKI